jgi:hypothetical protein
LNCTIYMTASGNNSGIAFGAEVLPLAYSKICTVNYHDASKLGFHTPNYH